VAGSQSRMVQSSDTDARRAPSGEKATVQTLPAWPSSVKRRAPVAGSQSRMVRSLDPDARRAASGEKATEQTPPPWPCKVFVFLGLICLLSLGMGCFIVSGASSVMALALGNGLS